MLQIGRDFNSTICRIRPEFEGSSKPQGAAYHQRDLLPRLCASYHWLQLATVWELARGSVSRGAKDPRVTLNGDLGSQRESPQAMGPSLTGFGRLTWEWTRLDNWPGLNTASKTERGQFEYRVYSTEAIYSCSDQDYDFWNDKTRQARTRCEWGKKKQRLWVSLFSLCRLSW